jgi:hypothetical protein
MFFYITSWEELRESKEPGLTQREVKSQMSSGNVKLIFLLDYN